MKLHLVQILVVVATIQLRMLVSGKFHVVEFVRWVSRPLRDSEDGSVQLCCIAG